MPVKFLFLLILITASLPVKASVELIFEGKVTPTSLFLSLGSEPKVDEFAIRIFENSENHKLRYASPYEDYYFPNAIAKAIVSNTTIDVRIEIIAVGYQTIVLNRLVTDTNEGYMVIDLGELELKPIQLPIIDQIESQFNDDGESLFIVNLSNDQTKDFTINKVAVELQLRLKTSSNFLFSTSGAIKTFQLSPEIKFDGTELATKVEDSSTGFQSLTSGKLSYQDGSSAVKFYFEFETFLLVKSDSHGKFNLLLPNQFEVSNSELSDTYVIRGNDAAVNSFLKNITIDLYTKEFDNTPIHYENNY